MNRTPPLPRTLTLKEVLEGSARAEERVSAWPEWKRELSASTTSSGSEYKLKSKLGAKTDKK